MKHLLCLLLLVGSVASAQTFKHLNPDVKAGDNQVKTLESFAKSNKVAMPNDWTWVIFPEKDWPKVQAALKIGSMVAVTMPTLKKTYINAGVFTVGNRKLFEFAVAHETAHVVCDIPQRDRKDEDRTDDAALRILGGHDLKSVCR